MRDWKEIAEFLHREVCMNFREFAESWSFVGLETWNSLFVKPETFNLWICFCVIFIHVNGDLWSLLSLSCIHACNSWFDDLSEGYCANHFDQLTISCLHSMSMTVVCVAASVGVVVFLCGLPWNGDPWVLFLTRSHSSFPWTGTGETGLKSGRVIGHVLQSN